MEVYVFYGQWECTPGMEKVIHLQLVLEGEQEGIELQNNERQRFAVKVCCKLHKQELKQKDLVFHALQQPFEAQRQFACNYWKVAAQVCN